MRMLMTGSADPNALEPSYARGLSGLPFELRTTVLSVPQRSGWRRLQDRFLLRVAQRQVFRQSNERLLQRQQLSSQA